MSSVAPTHRERTRSSELAVGTNPILGADNIRIERSGQARDLMRDDEDISEGPVSHGNIDIVSNIHAHVVAIRRGLVMIAFLFWLGCLPAYASPAGTWTGVAFCGWWGWLGNPTVEEADLQVRPDGSGFVGLLTINGNVKAKPVHIVPEADGRFRFKAQGDGLEIDAIATAPLVDPSRPGLSWFSVETKKPCTGLHLVRGHKIRPEIGNFHRACSGVLEVFKQADEAETLAKRLKEDKPELLQDYDPVQAKLAVLSDSDLVSGLSAEDHDRFLLFVADCGKFHPTGWQIEKLGAFFLRRAPSRRSRRQFWQPGPAFEPVVTGTELAALSAAQARIRMQLQGDLELLREANEDRLTELDKLIRGRSADLSKMPPTIVAAYVAATDDRLAMLRASRHLAAEFGLQTLPRLPSVEPEAEETAQPLRQDQIDELNAHRSPKL